MNKGYYYLLQGQPEMQKEFAYLKEIYAQIYYQYME